MTVSTFAARTLRPDPVVVERSAPTITWHSFDLLTGARGPQLPTRSLGTVNRIIGEPTELSGLAVLCWDEEAGAPVPGWDAATLPGRVMLVALNENDAPVWGGLVLRRRSDEGMWVEVDLVTLEAYFDRRYVGDQEFDGVTQGAIAALLISTYAANDGPAFLISAQDGPSRDRTYADDEDKTLLSVLQDLMAVQDGAEFTVDLEWADPDHTMLNRIVRVRQRLGTASDSPIGRFEMPGPVVGFSYVEDYTSDNGANDVMATSSGEGDSRPESDHQVATDLLAGGWVKYERRFTPSTSITDTGTLNAHATAELAETRNGLIELTLEVQLDAAPRFGEDFHLGDDVAVALSCPRFPEQMGPDGGLVPGYSATVRCVGVEVDYDARRLRPRLKEVG